MTDAPVREPPRPGRRPVPRLRLLFATAELAPLAQSGGLGEAVAGLARALAAEGHEVTCLLPAYRVALRHPACPELSDAGPVELAFPQGALRGRFLEGTLPDRVRLLLLDLPALYDRPGLYGDGTAPYADEGLRFIALSRAAATRCAAEQPDVLVAHDWHPALAVCLLRTLHDVGATRGIGTVQAVHNGAYQGRLAAAAMAATGLPGELFRPEGLEFFGDLCLLKAGLLWAERIVAVSPTYARELLSEPNGFGLEGVYRFREKRLLGIVNGFEVERYDPAADPALPATFDARHLTGKARCRSAILEELGLRPPEPGRFCIAIGRLASQKGWDVLVASLDGLVAGGASVALLGDGDPRLAADLAAAARRHPDRVAVRIGFDETLARRLYAGADQALVASRFEPCGLVQLAAQRYGTLPVAHRVGGLADTIEDGVTGVLFAPLSAANLVAAADRAAALLAEQGHAAVQRRLLSLDLSWRRPARRWAALLAEVAREAQARV